MDAIKNLKNTYNLVDLAHRIGLHTTQRRDHSETACPACEDQNGHHLYLYDDGRFFCHNPAPLTQTATPRTVVRLAADAIYMPNVVCP